MVVGEQLSIGKDFLLLVTVELMAYLSIQVVFELNNIRLSSTLLLRRTFGSADTIF